MKISSRGRKILEMVRHVRLQCTVQQNKTLFSSRKYPLNTHRIEDQCKFSWDGGINFYVKILEVQYEVIK